MQHTIINENGIQSHYCGISYTNTSYAECVVIVDFEGSFTPIFLAKRNENCIDTLKRYLRDKNQPHRVIGFYVKPLSEKVIDIKEKVELIQNDLQCLLELQPEELIDNACQIIVDRLKA
jgi:hypothetical protein